MHAPLAVPAAPRGPGALLLQLAHNEIPFEEQSREDVTDWLDFDFSVGERRCRFEATLDAKDVTEGGPPVFNLGIVPMSRYGPGEMAFELEEDFDGLLDMVESDAAADLWA